MEARKLIGDALTVLPRRSDALHQVLKEKIGRRSYQMLWFYNLFWGAKVTVQMRVLSAPTFFNKKIGICTQILYN